MSDAPSPPGPGWYPDWASPSELRWWDGSTWTDRTLPRAVPPSQQPTSPSPGLPPPPSSPPPPPPSATFPIPPPPPAPSSSAPAEQAVTNEERLVPPFKIVLLVAMVAALIQYGTTGWFLHDVLHDYLDALSQPRVGEQPSLPVWFELTSLLGLPITAASLLMLGWTYQVAAAGRALGLPARRKPLLAMLSFIIPVVNLWWPYQSVADSIGPADRRSVPLRLWWTSYVLLTILGLSFAVAIWWSPLASGLVSCAIGITLVTMFGCQRKLVAGISTIHRRHLDAPPTSFEAPRSEDGL